MWGLILCYSCLHLFILVTSSFIVWSWRDTKWRTLMAEILLWYSRYWFMTWWFIEKVSFSFYFSRPFHYNSLTATIHELIKWIIFFRIRWLIINSSENVQCTKKVPMSRYKFNIKKIYLFIFNVLLMRKIHDILNKMPQANHANWKITKIGSNIVQQFSRVFILTRFFSPTRFKDNNNVTSNYLNYKLTWSFALNSQICINTFRCSFKRKARLKKFHQKKFSTTIYFVYGVPLLLALSLVVFLPP